MAGLDGSHYHDDLGAHYINPSSDKANEAAEAERRAAELARQNAPEYEMPPYEPNGSPPGYSGISTPSIDRYISIRNIHRELNGEQPDNAGEVGFESKPSRGKKCMIFIGIVVVAVIGVGIGAGVYFALKHFEMPADIATTIMPATGPSPPISTDMVPVEIPKAIVQECHGKSKAQLYGMSGRVEVLSYGHNASCTWIIEVPSDKIALFTLESSNTHSSPGSYDFIYFSSKTSTVKLYIRGRNTAVFKYTYGVSNIIVQLTSDHVNLGIGFKGYWTAENYEDILCMGRKNLTGHTGEINTNPGASYYADNMYCEWLITVPEKHRVSLELLRVELNNDPISIFDAASPSNTSIFHSTRKGSKSSILALGRSLFIVFASNPFGVGNGFRARYTAVPVE